MFGADTSLVMDALQIAALATVAGGGIVFLAVRRGKQVRPDPGTGATAPADRTPEETTKADLEERVRVLERIATDRPADLAREIEALRDTPRDRGRQLEGETQ